MGKIDSIMVVQYATEMPLGEAKHLAHHSQAWADRRETDDDVENAFWRALFIDCLVGHGQINEPDQWAADCRVRQQRARAHMRSLAANLPDEVLLRYRRSMDENLLGQAFAALADAGQTPRRA